MQKNKILLLLIILVSCTSEQKDNKKIEAKSDIPKVIEVDAPEKEVEVDVYAADSVIGKTEEVLIEKAPIIEKEKIKPTKPKVVAPSSKIFVESPNYSFGRVTEGEVIKHTFTFENRGKADLVIKDVLVDCGCTVPSFPKEAIVPGESGEVEVTFNTKGKMGNQERFITILTNGEPRSKIVKLMGIVDTE